ncbi:hypothetical protein EDD86DRAFT_244320 [Gorgonomyces haynaldii]|nr:hypothetical protein EDD86DRAFT_244320 [Gorgonomyces haynaldii]
MLENDLLCQAYGVAVISLFSIFHIPLNPYLVLVLKKPTLSKRMTIICFCYMTLVSTLIAVWIYFSGDRYALSPNNAYCYLNLEHPTPGTIRALLINMFFYSSPLFVISYLYYHIYLALQRIKKDKQEQEVKQSTATGPDDRLLKLQIQIAWRGALVLLVFLVGYAYPIIYLVTRGLLRIDYHIMFDLFFAWSIISNLLFNPIVYYMTDPRVIGIAHEMLPFLPNTSFFEKNMSKSESELQPKRLRAAPLSTPQLNETVKITDTIAIKPTEIH